MVIGALGSAAESASSCATTRSAISWSMPPEITMVRTAKSRSARRVGNDDSVSVISFLGAAAPGRGDQDGVSAPFGVVPEPPRTDHDQRDGACDVGRNENVTHQRARGRRIAHRDGKPHEPEKDEGDADEEEAGHP